MQDSARGDGTATGPARRGHPVSPSQPLCLGQDAGKWGKIRALGPFGQILLPWVGTLLGSISWARRDLKVMESSVLLADGPRSSAGTARMVPSQPPRTVYPPGVPKQWQNSHGNTPFCPQLLGTFLCSPPNASWGCKTNTYLQPGPNSQQLSQLSLMARESHSCVGPSSAGFGQLRAEPH